MKTMGEQEKTSRTRGDVLGVAIDAVDWDTALERISRWAGQRQSRYVCVCNVHSVVTAVQHSSFRTLLDQADMATPDGAPIAWMLRRLGFANQPRINGPDLMWRYCEQAAQSGQSIYLYGGTERTLRRLQARLTEAFPELRIAGAWSPPFRTLSPEEDAEAINRINQSGAGVVFVSLGCPKQELWTAAHRGQVNAVMVGVGAAFDFHAGTIKRAPQWMRTAGLEWFHRLCSEPRRLYRRYLVTNTLFIIGVARQMRLRRPHLQMARKIRLIPSWRHVR